LEPCIPSQSSQKSQPLAWFTEVDLLPHRDRAQGRIQGRSVPTLVSSATQIRSVGPSNLGFGAVTEAAAAEAAALLDADAADWHRPTPVELAVGSARGL
jgi:hypothetical protein